MGAKLFGLAVASLVLACSGGTAVHGTSAEAGFGGGSTVDGTSAEAGFGGGGTVQCEPRCIGGQCGDDGCGRSCGACDVRGTYEVTWLTGPYETTTWVIAGLPEDTVLTWGASVFRGTFSGTVLSVTETPGGAETITGSLNAATMTITGALSFVNSPLKDRRAFVAVPKH